MNSGGKQVSEGDGAGSDGPSSRGLRYLPALDGIRGLAVVAVLLFHGDLITGGYLGVDAFFVLSGFLITSLLLVETGATGRVDLRAFWIRRARRLLPALFAVLLAVGAYAVLFAAPGELGRIRADAFATLGYVANWNSISADHGYWALFEAPSPLEHTWSLAIEEQFYLVWPLVVFALAWLARRVAGPRVRWRPEGAAGERRTADAVAPVLFGACVLLGAASAALMFARYDPGDTSRAYLGTDTRAASILFGAALAAWIAWRGPVRRRGARVALEVVALGSAALLGTAWVLLDGQSELLYRGGFLACGLGAAAVIASAASPRPGPVARALSFAPLRALGIISYGLYLWHWPVYVAMSPDRTGLEGDALLAARIAVSLAFAIASYYLIERPIRHGTFVPRKIAIAVPATAAACALALFAATTGAVSTDATAAPAVSTLTAGPQTAARVDGALATAAGRLPRSTTPRVLVVGDSVGGGFADAGVMLQEELGVSVRKAVYPGCVLTPRVTDHRLTIHERLQPAYPEACEPTWLEGVRTHVPDSIVMIYGTGAAFTELAIEGHWAAPCDPVYRAWYEEELGAVTRDLGRSGADIWIARMPEMSADWLPGDANQRIACINAVHQTIADALPNVMMLELADRVCPGGTCPELYEGEKLRFDGMHFSRRACADLARWFMGQVLADRISGSSLTQLPQLF